MKIPQPIIWSLAMLLLLFLATQVVLVGDDISFTTLLAYLSGDLPDGYQLTVIHELRLPKVVMAVLAGASLALAGFMMQQLVNNPLADPYLISTASGASLGVNLTISGFLPAIFPYLYVLPFYGFVFGMLSTLLVVVLSKQKGQVNTLILIIGGVSVSSLLTACTSLIVYYSDSTAKLRSILFWAMGSFEKTQWQQIPLLLVLLVVVLVASSFIHRHLLILMMGNTKAKQLGANVGQLQILLLCFSALLVGVVVAYCGPIGFVGLIVPHFSRAFVGLSSRSVLVFTALAGAGFMLACEWIAQLIVPEVGLPVGLVASFIGVPFFLYLLFNRKYHFSK